MNREIDLRTPLQKERDERNQKIYEEYLEIKNNLPPNTSKLSIWRVIGNKYSLKPQGIRTIIMKMKTEKSDNNATPN